jgi:hypothetical protein
MLAVQKTPYVQYINALAVLFLATECKCRLLRRVAWSQRNSLCALIIARRLCPKVVEPTGFGKFSVLLRLKGACAEPD